MVKIEAGKYYKTRDGIKVGPIRNYDDKYFYKSSFCCGKWTYLENGKWSGSTKEDNRDLIEEWQDDNQSPVRTVTRKEIVAGKYGIVTIKECGFIHINAIGTPDNLREAAHILNQIAEVLEDGTTF